MWLGDAPDVFGEDAGDIDIQYLGPLARAQRIDEVASIERFSNTAQVLAQTDPAVLDVADFDGALRAIGDRLAVPAELMRDDREVKKLRDQRAQAQAQALQTQQAQEEGAAMKAIAEGQQAEQQANQGVA